MEAVSQVAGTFFSGVWTLLLKTDFPGIGVSLAGVMISLLLIRASIRIFQLLTGFGVNGSDYPWRPPGPVLRGIPGFSASPSPPCWCGSRAQ